MNYFITGVKKLRLRDILNRDTEIKYLKGEVYLALFILKNKILTLILSN